MSDFKYRITNDEDYKVMIKKLDFTKENKRLVKLYKENPSNEIMGEILTLNEGLVLNIIEMYKGILQYMEIDDLYTEGMLGLMKAVEKYDVDGTYAFSTYASFWIKQCCSRYIKTHNRMIRIPEYSSNNIYTKMLIFGQNIMFFSQTCRLILFLQELSFGLYWSPCLTPHRNIRLQHKAFQCPRSDCFLVSEPDTYS